MGVRLPPRSCCRRTDLAFGDGFSFDPELVAKNWYNASSLVGCGNEGDTMKCMQSKNFNNIKAAVAVVLP